MTGVVGVHFTQALLYFILLTHLIGHTHTHTHIYIYTNYVKREIEKDRKDRKSSLNRHSYNIAYQLQSTNFNDSLYKV